jgi:hypothetical protein
MNYININTQQTEIPSTVGITKGVTWDNSQEMLKELGWRIRPELPPVEEGYERLSVVYVEGDGTTASAQYTDTLIQDRLNAEEAARQALAAQQAQQAIIDEQNRQLNKPLELKKTENNFLLICEQLSGNRNKLGFEELNTIIEGLLVSDQNTAVVLSIKLLSLDAAGKRLGGNLWWDDCVWHEDIV